MQSGEAKDSIIEKDLRRASRHRRGLILCASLRRQSTETCSPAHIVVICNGCDVNISVGKGCTIRAGVRGMLAFLSGLRLFSSYVSHVCAIIPRRSSSRHFVRKPKHRLSLTPFRACLPCRACRCSSKFHKM